MLSYKKKYRLKAYKIDKKQYVTIKVRKRLIYYFIFKFLKTGIKIKTQKISFLGFIIVAKTGVEPVTSGL
jgi:hypothetical protein